MSLAYGTEYEERGRAGKRTMTECRGCQTRPYRIDEGGEGTACESPALPDGDTPSLEGKGLGIGHSSSPFPLVVSQSNQGEGSGMRGTRKVWLNDVSPLHHRWRGAGGEATAGEMPA